MNKLFSELEQTYKRNYDLHKTFFFKLKKSPGKHFVLS